MEFPYVIQFDEDDYVDENSQPITKEDVSSNEDILKEVDIQEIDGRERKQEKQLVTTVDYVKPNASDELKRYVQRAVRGRANNVVGVFGNRADNVVKELCGNLQELEDNIVFAGNVDYDRNVDIYNSVAALFLEEIQNSDWSEDMDVRFYRESVVNKLSEVYECSQSSDFDSCYSPIEGLRNISRRNARHKELLAVVHSIKQLNNVSFLRRNDPKFLITIDVGIGVMDYKFLHSLEKLDSSDLIIIVYTIVDFDDYTRVFQLADKFFGTGNYVIATTAGIN